MPKLIPFFLTACALSVACSDAPKTSADPADITADDNDDAGDRTGDDPADDETHETIDEQADAGAPPKGGTKQDGGPPIAMDARVPVRDASSDASKDASSDASKDAKTDASSPLDDGGATHGDSGAAHDGGSATRDGGSDAGRRDGGSPGTSTTRTVTVGSAMRTFQLYIPSGLDESVPVPLVSVHHGFTMSGKIMEQVTSWKAIAEREGVVVAFPDGGNGAGPWNVGTGVCSPGDVVSAPPEQDDFGLVEAIVSAAAMEQAIDERKVFVGGFSMGGFFANNIGCKGRDLVRAVAAHSSGTYPGECPGKPVPVLMIHGDADGLIPFDTCGQAAYGYWVERNGCGSEVETESIAEGSCSWNKGCPEGQEVGFCQLRGMNHGWAGAAGEGDYLGAVLYPLTMDNTVFGGGAQYEDGAELMWKFFARYL